MNKIVSILLIGFLGFLGCSDGDNGTTTVDQATPVAPFGIIETPSPTYEWTPVSGVTKYRLMVQDTNQASTTQDTSDTTIIDEWYTAEEAGCASEDGLCMATPDIEVFEENTWKVQACGTQECGQWSESINFDVSANIDYRFIVHGDATVTDLSTGLIWSQNANLYGPQWWVNAHPCCDDMVWHGIGGWRLPSTKELYSLIDRGWPHIPLLPPNHPFTNIPPLLSSLLIGHWTSQDCSDMYRGTGKYQVNFWVLIGTCTCRHLDITPPLDHRGYVWCVRDAQR